MSRLLALSSRSPKPDVPKRACNALKFYNRRKPDEPTQERPSRLVSAAKAFVGRKPNGVVLPSIVSYSENNAKGARQRFTDPSPVGQTYQIPVTLCSLSAEAKTQAVVTTLRPVF